MQQAARGGLIMKQTLVFVFDALLGCLDALLGGKYR